MHSGRYQQANDSTPTRLPSAAELDDAIPRVEAKSRGGNKNYTVRGKHYTVLENAVNYQQTGVASWYGRKFHGHLTSNGEIYDMYAMSAAHKSLPLPTYLKVTNLDNNKTVIVRVNDRGPFHENRIIDLSYSAAYKIGMLKEGTANVHIEAITDVNAFKHKQREANNLPTTQTKTVIAQQQKSDTTDITLAHTTESEDIYVQVFATKDIQVAKNTAHALSTMFQQNVVTPYHQGVYRVQLGPFKETDNLTPLIASLKQSGYPNAFRRKILQ